jgi:hypothetical protein
MLIHEEYGTVELEQKKEFCEKEIKVRDDEIKGDINKSLEKVKFAVLVAGKWFNDLDEFTAKEEKATESIGVTYKNTNFNFTVTVNIGEKKIEL